MYIDDSAYIMIGLIVVISIATWLLIRAIAKPSNKE